MLLFFVAKCNVLVKHVCNAAILKLLDVLKDCMSHCIDVLFGQCC